MEALAFHDLVSLETLEMENNKNLEDIDRMAFYNNVYETRPNLIPRVYLSNNGLTFVSSDLLRWSESSEVSLEGNPWHCGCELSWMADHKGEAFEYSDFLVCASPEEVKDLPFKELDWEDYGCQELTKYGWITLALLVAACMVLAAAVGYGVFRVWENHRRAQGRPMGRR